MASGHTPRSLKYLRDSGDYYLIGVVEKWQVAPGRPGGGVRVDLFGIIDILALGRGGTLAVQVTSAGQFAAHMKHIREHRTTVHELEVSTAALILEAGWRIEVHGWAKPKHRWELTRKQEFKLDQPTTEE